MLTSLVSPNLSLTNPQPRGGYWIIRKKTLLVHWILHECIVQWVSRTSLVKLFIFKHSRSTQIKCNYNTTNAVSRIFVFIFKKQFTYEYTIPKIFIVTLSYTYSVHILPFRMNHISVEHFWNPSHLHKANRKKVS